MLSHFVQFHQQYECAMRHHEIPGNPSESIRPCVFAVHSFRGDATNSDTWRGGKVQSLQVTSEYSGVSGEPALFSLWPDVQEVVDGTAKGTIELVLRQLRLVGCPCMEGPTAVPPAHAVRVTIVCGDCGSDQVGFRKWILLTYASDRRHIIITQACFSHQFQLCIKPTLALGDILGPKWKLNRTYYATLVNICNLLRSKPSGVLNAAKELFGDRGRELDSEEVPRCLAGRWLC